MRAPAIQHKNGHGDFHTSAAIPLISSLNMTITHPVLNLNVTGDAVLNPNSLRDVVLNLDTGDAILNPDD
jgi:hypothetical protein